MRASAAASGATARQERAERLRRDRAASQPLRVTFPAVQTVRLELQFSGTSNPPASQAHVLHPPARSFFDFPCPYADCDGHFDLSNAVNGALSASARQVAGALSCTGLRARDHASKQPCELQLAYKIIATY
jgi:hypothetical protein